MVAMKNSRTRYGWMLATILVLFSHSTSGQKRADVLVDFSKLQSVINRADKIIVYDTSDFRHERQIYTSHRQRDLLSLRSAIRTESPPQWFRCACEPSLVIRFYGHDRQLGEVEIFSGVTIRFAKWSSDAQISNAEAWFQWLDSRGIKGPRREFEEEAARERDALAAEDRWMKQMPGSLRPLWAEVVNRDPVGGYDTSVLEAALLKEYPDQPTRILELLSWYGSGAGPWSGYPAYEGAAEQMLLKYSTSEVVGAVYGRHLSDSELEGTARLFGGWEFNRTRPHDNTLIPFELQKALLEHSLNSSDEDKKERARKAFQHQAPTR